MDDHRAERHADLDDARDALGAGRQAPLFGPNADDNAIAGLEMRAHRGCRDLCADVQRDNSFAALEALHCPIKEIG